VSGAEDPEFGVPPAHPDASIVTARAAPAAGALERENRIVMLLVVRKFSR
jgi:hypothetical protein